MDFSADLIASLVNGIVEGDGDVKVNTFAKIEEGHTGALSFLANPKYTHFIYDTQSSVVLVKKDFVAEKPVKATLIRVEDPYATLSYLLDMVTKATAEGPAGIEQPSCISEGVEVPEDAYVGAFSYVGKGVRIGRGVKIYPQSYVGDNVVIGDGTVLYAGVKVYHGCRIGSGCIIHSGAVIGADGFGFAPMPDGSYHKIPQIGGVEIGDNVEIGANTTIDRATMGDTRVHSGVKLDNLIQIAHNVEVGTNTVMAAQVGVAGSAKIGSQCMIGGQVGVAGHIRIGDKVEVGAQSGIPHSVRDGSRIIGYPAVPIEVFARQAAGLKRLSDLFDRVGMLEKQANKKENK